MDSIIIDEFKDIVYKVNRYFDIYKYNVVTSENIINVSYEYPAIFYPHNFLKMYNDLLTSKIYKYREIYWNFSPLINIKLDIVENKTHIDFSIEIQTQKYIDTYLNILPTEILNMVAGYLGIVDINNFCVYMKTWEYCDESLYKILYQDNFNEFYQMMYQYLQYEFNSWQNRYNSLLWEEVKTVEQLHMKYYNLKPRSPHINFILTIYNLLYNPRINVQLGIYTHQKNKELFKTIFKNMDFTRQKRYRQEFQKLNHIDILIDIR